MNICKVLTVAGADQEEVVKAIENSDFKDFEDCLQDRCAVSVAAWKKANRIEAQKSSAPSKLGYHLENRIVFYLARMISVQKQTEFFHNDFDNLKKVRSIWICMDSSETEDSIEEIGFERKVISACFIVCQLIGKCKEQIVRLNILIALIDRYIQLIRIDTIKTESD